MGKDIQYKKVLAALLKGPVYHENNKLWNMVLTYESPIREYFSTLDLDLHLDEPDGFAFLKSKSSEKDEDSVSLMRKQQLRYDDSLLCVLLREALLEFDRSQSHDQRPIKKKEELHELMRPFYKIQTNEVKQIDKFDTTIKRVEQFGFLSRIKDSDEYEIKRIIKAKVSADKIEQMKEMLKNHAR